MHTQSVQLANLEVNLMRETAECYSEKTKQGMDMERLLAMKITQTLGSLMKCSVGPI